MRALDALLAGVGCLLLAPLLLILGAMVRLSSPGPALHRAVRVGKDGRLFHLLKLRTMVQDAARTGPGITGDADPRITPIGRILRRYKLDELPQLLNVLKGEMSLVGPRPEDPRYVALYTPLQRRLLERRPGITSAASLVYRDESRLLSGSDWETRYIGEILPHKLDIELEYLSHRTALSDLGMILRTLWALVHP